MKISLVFAADVIAVTMNPAFTHLNPSERGFFTVGFSHRHFRVDHILTMEAVGLWESRLGGIALILVPMCFVVVMPLSFSSSLSNMSLPFVESVVLASVIKPVLSVAVAFHAPTLTAAILVGSFALLHDYAHGGEIGGSTILSYGIELHSRLHYCTLPASVLE